MHIRPNLLMLGLPANGLTYLLNDADSVRCLESDGDDACSESYEIASGIVSPELSALPEVAYMARILNLRGL